MDASLNIAIAAEFDLCEKIAEALEQSELDVGKVSIVEIYPFEEEQAVRFRNKAVAQLDNDEIEWDNKLIAILGPCGIGKITMLMQHTYLVV